MAENKHTIQELRIRQSLPLEIKIRMSKQRIKEWIEEFGEDGVYVSFSGGKDSTVLLNLVREDYPNVPAVFVDTGLEYPEIREFVKTFDNVVWLKPQLNFRQVIERYGYPFISKEVSDVVYYSRRYLDNIIEGEDIGSPWAIADLLDVDRRKNKEGEDYKALKNGDYIKRDMAYQIIKARGEKHFRLRKLYGELEHKEKGKPTGEISMTYNKSRYKFFLGAPFEISSYCCNVMKKAPTKKYGKESGRVPMTGQMAEESQLRTAHWLQQGCNAFDNKHPISNPLSFWTNQDVLKYIKEKSIKICNIYGDVVPDYDYMDQINGQQDLSDLGLIEDNRRYKTTGCQRTGCMFCGYGCHLEKAGEGRFEKMKETHPKIYDYIMRPKEEGGLNYKEVIDWINENGNLNIRY